MGFFGEVLTAMCTPMRQDGSVDFEQAQRLAVHLVDNGSDGIVVAGTTGESPTLSFDEKVNLFRRVVEAVGDRARVIAGTGSYNTDESVRLTRSAASTGVDGVMLVAPYYNRPPQDGLYRHFRAVAESTTLPVMLYNVPPRTAVNLEPDTLARLARVNNIVALKEAAGSTDQVTAMRAVLPDDFSIYSGDDPFTLPMLALGAVGVVSVAAHVVGPDIKRMIALYKQGDTAGAAALHARLAPIFKAMFLTTNPIPVKWSMSLLGLDLGPFRLPLVPPTGTEKARIREVFAAHGLLQV